ncbi:MAG: twitching motility protein PilT, partial [Cyanobacteria bacterium NC_groundwater_1444_Ag_S-0.65um_54_12]|nr:twitching motility protein PilT [Cyanobacteria bacterium NC_groundwater_1444_Ag_S-0.65um_54_12]
FPPHQQQQIRVQISNGLVAVLSQTLAPRIGESGKGGRGRVMALEIMVNTPAIANLIREGKTAQIYSAIQTGQKFGMQTLENALKELYFNRLVAYEDVVSKTSRPEDLIRMIGAAPSSTMAQSMAH